MKMFNKHLDIMDILLSIHSYFKIMLAYKCLGDLFYCSTN